MKFAKQLYNAVKTETRVSEADFVSLARDNLVVLAIKRMLEGKLAELRAVPEADYDKASWAYRQADRNGAIRALTDALKLME